MTLRECAQALYDQQELSFSITKGRIEWPYRLIEDASDKHGYSDSSTFSALQQAASIVVEIITGARPHPVVGLFRTFMASKNPRNPSDVTSFVSRYMPCDLLAGDESMISEHLVRLQEALQKSPSTLGFPEEALVFGIALFLFRLILLRTYLERKPSDDLALYNALAQGDVLVVRALSHSERAAAAYDGMRNTKNPSHSASTVLCEGLLSPSPAMPVFEGPIASIKTLDGDPYEWPASQDHGLIAEAEEYAPSCPREQPDKQQGNGSVRACYHHDETGTL
ncbi:hypothetical protein C8Q73DRAFT_791964 [Cubamyces lactineus]|nr:hypothetical protein C8Q73DRAFT_791964 [Cubamyces lactineus]